MKRVKLVCLSLYPTDIELLEKKVEELQARGYSMNKSKLVRLAIKQLAVEGVRHGKTSR